ncbi:asparaginase [Micromonospora sp. NBRC 101691]|uniref:asparaginase n=1 Tax=Micromonospora sp. NBRC 101691 TaxID=3032198 RepID=UPI00249FED66|nr:asparaginase [Micromonospora sp. NBRC 101691]GLY23534.1 asparaginase [Micromonospora sp. NBRC 101691]
MGTTYAGGALLAEVVRSGFVEGLHHGSVVVLDASGEVVAAAGDVDGPIFPRSASKPMQTIGMLRAGLRLTDPADLALVSASHAGEDFHLARVTALLAAAGLDGSALACPPDLPLDEAARNAVLAAGGGPDRIGMNCSGKHTGMVLTCRAAGWPTEGYPHPEHPLQQRIRATVEEITGEPVAAAGVDGCGAPVLAVSLTGLARAFLRLVQAEPGTPERTVADAMRAHPEIVGGTRAEDSRLMRGLPGTLAKIGAEGIIAAGLPGVGSVAVKIDDGATRARMPVLVSALRRLGQDAPILHEYAELPLLGGGVPVGAIRPTW